MFHSSTGLERAANVSTGALATSVFLRLQLIVRRSSRKRVFVWGVQRPMLRGVARGLRPVVDVPASVPQGYFDVQLSGYPYG